MATPTKKPKTTAAKAPKAAADKPAKPAAAAKGAKSTRKGAKPAKATKVAVPEPDTAVKPTFSERFWHRLGMRAKQKEELAHQHHEEQLAAERAAAEQAEREAREERKRQAAEERKARAAAAREMARIAREEDERLKREADEAEARAAEEKKEQRRQAAAAKREQARLAKEEAARAAQERAEEKRRQREEKAEQKRREAELARLERDAAARRKQEAEEQAAEEPEEAGPEEEEVIEGPAVEVDLREAEPEAEPEPGPEEAPEPAEDEEEETEDADEEPEEAPVVVRKGREAPAAEPDAEDADETPSKRSKAKQVDEWGEAVEVRTSRGKADPAPRAPPAAPEPKPAASSAAAPKPADEAAAVPATELDEQADRVAAELRARRSKPIQIEAEDDVVPTLPVGRGASGRKEEPKEVLQLDPAPPARIQDLAPRGLSVPEQYLLLTLEDGWDERAERVRPGGLGGALTGALLLDLVLRGALKVQRDRFQLQDADLDDAAEAVAKKLEQFDGRPSLQAMTELAKWLPQLLPAYKQRMADRGLIDFRAWRHMGLFYRSQVALLDPDAQERLRNKLGRAIAGGGRPDAPTILALGLLEASGKFGLVVPEGAQAYNRKRLNGLLAGKDVMGYKVDDELKGMQEIAVRTVLDNVRVLTVRG